MTYRHSPFRWRLRDLYWRFVSWLFELRFEDKPSGYLAITNDGDYVGAWKALSSAVLINNKNPDNRKCKIVPFWIQRQ